ncbi:MAG: phosphopantetheine-binding protein, partial [Acidobacteriota bacterium]
MHVTVEEFTLKKVNPSSGESDKKAAGQGEDKEAGDLFDAILPEEAVEAFHRMLLHRVPQVVMVDGKDLATSFKRGQTLARVRTGEEKAAAKPKHQRPELQSTYEEPTTPLQETLAGIWREHLGIEKIGIRDDYFELGGDSILGIRIIAAVKEAGYELTPAQLFEYTTVADLAAFLEQDQGSADEGGSLEFTLLQKLLMDRPRDERSAIGVRFVSDLKAGT